MSQQQRKRVIPKIRRNRLVRGKTILPVGVKEILGRIVGEMGDCCGGNCDDHAVRFSNKDLKIAKAALAASR
jgi:hypothetical protein